MKNLVIVLVVALFNTTLLFAQTAPREKVASDRQKLQSG